MHQKLTLLLALSLSINSIVTGNSVKKVHSEEINPLLGITCDNPHYIELLLRNNANPNACAVYKKDSTITALGKMCLENYPKNANQLIVANADPNKGITGPKRKSQYFTGETYENKTTPLGLASQNLMASTVKVMIAANAELNHGSINKDGVILTPLGMVFDKQNNDEVVTHLLSAGAIPKKCLYVEHFQREKKELKTTREHPNAREQEFRIPKGFLKPYTKEEYERSEHNGMPYYSYKDKVLPTTPDGTIIEKSSQV